MKRLLALGLVLSSATLLLAQQDPRDVAVRAAQPYVSARQASLPTGSTLEPGEVFLDDIGQAHIRYQHFYQGIPVFESEAIAHVDLQSASFIGLTDALQAFGAIPTRPGLPAAAARGQAFDRLGLPPGLASRDDLMVLVDEGMGFLAWRVHANGDDNGRDPVDHIAFVDARSGDVRRSWDNLQTAAATGSGKGFFSGLVDLTTDSLTSGFRLRDPNRGNQLTCDMRNAQGSCYYMDDADNVWGDYSLGDRQSVAVDAQYGTARTWDYYQQIHGRNGIANNGTGAYNRVHFGRNYANAYWSDACFCMTYGDGDNKTYNPFDSLDVAGHEMSHGVTSRTAKLTYSGESGGLNEGTSDIFGTMVEYFAGNANDTPDYQIGERLYKSGTKALRYMYKPSLDGKSADCWYSGVGSLNVHYSSGVANHFFYLLAEGSTNSSTCDTTSSAGRVATGSQSLTGIGRSAAERIWYRALTVYMTASTKYANARVATINAATDLYGATAPEIVTAVSAAWSAVNVN